MKDNSSNRSNIYYQNTPSLAAKSTFFYIQSAGHFFCRKNYSVKRQNLKSFLLIYTLDGKGYARYRDKFCEISKGQILFIDCMEYHEYFSDEKDLWEFYFIHFNGSSSSEYFKLIYQNYGSVIDLSNVTSIPENMEDLLKLLKLKDLQFDIKASGIIVEILTSILLAYPQNETCLYSGNINRFNAVINLIEQKYDSKITVEEMARTECLSPYHFSRLFRKLTGYSPYEYLTKYRINKAKTMLINTSFSIDSIAGKVGFESTSNFIKTFRKLENITPLEFRALSIQF